MVPFMTRLSLLAVDRNGEAHVLHSFFSVPVGPYDPERRLFRCRGELPSEGLPLSADISAPSFALRRIAITVMKEYHIAHVELVPPLDWRTRTCKRASIKSEVQDLACRGLAFLPLDMSTLLFNASANIV